MIKAIHAHLFNKRGAPHVWIRREHGGRYYKLTRASYQRLWRALLGKSVAVSLSGWLWLGQIREEEA